MSSTSKRTIDCRDKKLPFKEFSYHPSADGVNENVLVLFHGLGDSYKPFETLGLRMQLPQTATLSLQGPIVVPFDLGHSWYQSFDSNGNVLSPLQTDSIRNDTIKQTRHQLEEFLTTLISDYGWKNERIFFFGYSEGGAIVLDLIAHSKTTYGGAVVVGSSWIEDTLRNPPKFESYTPLLMLHGRADPVWSVDLARETAAKYKAGIHGRSKVDLQVFNKGHGMIANADEMRYVMAFLAEHLYLRNLALENHPDIIEING